MGRKRSEVVLVLLALGALSLAVAGCSSSKDSTSGMTEPTATSEPAPVDEADINMAASSVTVSTESALKTAINNAQAGSVIKINGTIKLTSTLQLLKSGTASAKISFTGGALDCSGISSGWGVKVNGSYWNITNMTVKNAPDCGIVFQSGGYNYVSNVITCNNKDSGIQIYNGGHDNNIVNCTSYNNYDTKNGGENADGYACKLSGGKNNKFQGCTAYSNSDDGWDLYGQPYTVTMTGCTARNHGLGANGDGNGFKLGSAGQKVPHTVTNCIANNNKGCGYDGNGNTGHITTTGSTGSGNAKGLFYRIY